MSIVVIGGQTRKVGKTSVIAGLIAAMPEMHWTAIKITQHRHEPDAGGRRLTDFPSMLVAEERDCSGTSDTSRFLVAGAEKAYLVRAPEGLTAEVMTKLRETIGVAENVIFESNSVMKFLQPDLYMAVLDFANPDFKDSAREFFDHVNAVVLQNSEICPDWQGVSLKPAAGKPVFPITPPPYVTVEIVNFVRTRLLHQI